MLRMKARSHTSGRRAGIACLFLSLFLFPSCAERYFLEKDPKRFIRNAPRNFILVNQGNEDSTFYELAPEERIHDDRIHMQDEHDGLGFTRAKRETGTVIYQGEQEGNEEIRIEVQKRENGSTRLELGLNMNSELEQHRFNWENAAIGDIHIGGERYENVRYLEQGALKVWFSIEKGLIKLEADSTYERVL